MLGVDDFALKRRHRYATVIIDGETGERIDVLPGRTAQTLTGWLREHPGIEHVCRDGSGCYAEATRQTLPDAVQVRQVAPLVQPVRHGPRRDPLPRRLLSRCREPRPTRRRTRAGVCHGAAPAHCPIAA